MDAPGNTIGVFGQLLRHGARERGQCVLMILIDSFSALPAGQRSAGISFTSRTRRKEFYERTPVSFVGGARFDYRVPSFKYRRPTKLSLRRS